MTDASATLRGDDKGKGAAPMPQRSLSTQAWLACLLAAECAVFSYTGSNFASISAAAEVVRLSVEIGLVALALTPVLVTGGIDLSVGSTLGLTGVVFGKLWRDAGIPTILAAPIAVIVVGGLAGTANGLLITRLRIPPLIVTLGTMSVYRGLAEGITGGVDNFTDFPESFLQLGQGYFAGAPVQTWVLAAVAVGYALWLERSIAGREILAIGFANADAEVHGDAPAARHAGLPVDRRTFSVYLMSGLVSALAGIVYVSHLGQAKADAGTGYELLAVTACVLGGTSIFGGRGTVAGTMLGLFAISVLQIGLRLSDVPAEWAGILTGGFLLAAGSADLLTAAGFSTRSPTTISASRHSTGALDMRNTQIAALCIAMLAAAAMIAGSNRQLAESVREAVDAVGRRQQNGQAGSSFGQAAESGTVAQSGAGSADPTSTARRITVAMMPKSKGNAYFIACRRGAQEAAKELNVDLLWDGPTDPDPARQNEVVDAWIARGVDVIAVAVENRVGVSSVLKKARQRGIRVITWDADAEPDAREFFVNQATPEGIGHALMDNAARIMQGSGEFAIITASLTASNMIEWQRHIEARRAEKYPRIKMAALRPCDDLQKRAFDEANTILAAHPQVKLIMAICSPGPPGAAEAVLQSGRKDVKVMGLSLPNDNKRFIHAGITECIILWNTMDLGYLTIHAARQLVDGRLKAGDSQITAGRLGRLEIAGDNILLGKPFVFDKNNVDQFDF